jgi:hypothetical protein
MRLNPELPLFAGVSAWAAKAAKIKRIAARGRLPDIYTQTARIFVLSPSVAEFVSFIYKFSRFLHFVATSRQPLRGHRPNSGIITDKFQSVTQKIEKKLTAMKIPRHHPNPATIHGQIELIQAKPNCADRTSDKQIAI